LGGFSLCQLCAVSDDDRVDDSDREITFTVDSGACVTVVPLDHPAARGYRVHQDGKSGATYGTAMKGGKKIVDQGKRVLQTKVVGSGLPMRLDTRKADVSKPLLAVCQMVDANHTVLFDSSGSYAINKRTGLKTPFTRKNGDWHLKLNLEAPKTANKVMGQVLAEMRELKEKSAAPVEPEVTLHFASGIGGRAPDGSQKVNVVGSREQGAPQKVESRVEPLFRMAVGG
jgi:hypothetical protein